MSFQLPTHASSVFLDRRRRLSKRIGETPTVVFAGCVRPRNYAANIFRYRSDSHFLYFVGAHMPDAVLVGNAGHFEIFATPEDPQDPLWHGDSPGWDEVVATTGVAAVRPLSELAQAIDKLGGAERVATIPAVDPVARRLQANLLGRAWGDERGVPELGSLDAAFADAVVGLRLTADPAGISSLREAQTGTRAGHLAAMAQTRAGCRGHVIRAALEAEFAARGMSCAYNSIVTVHGEILHNEHHHHELRGGDLLLADAGAEHDGWASDVTRTWPVSGKFSPTQREIYDIVLQAQVEACDRVRSGSRYRDLHLGACLTLTRGLVELGILRGSPESLVERGAHALFFPHGLGHLIGLDVHDMEDLGDRAGYAPGRDRSSQFGLCYLRLDRDLEPGMVVTIEPGFYNVPAILRDKQLCGPFDADGTLNRERLAQFGDVRGIRIEDDVLCTAGDPEVLSAAIVKDPAGVEAQVGTAFP